jgi:putative nucleotidyltransferase with HDIG domain
MSYMRRFPVILNLLVIAVTVVFVALALVVGRAQAEEAPVLRVGQPSPQDFVAPRFISIEDTAATEAARALAAASVQTKFSIDPLASNTAKNTVRAFFQAIRDAAFIPINELPPPPPDPVEPIDPPTPTAPPPTIAPPPTTAPPETTTTVTEDTAGAGTDTTEPVETTTTTSTTTTTTTTLPPETTTTTTTLPRREQERQVELVEEGFIIYAGVIPYFVSFYNDDLDAQAVGEPPVFDDVEAQILDIVDTQLAAGIKEAELTERAQELLADPPGVFAPGFSAEQTTELENAAARVIAQALRVNNHPDEPATQEERDARADEVETITVEFVASQPIVNQNENISLVQFKALIAAGLVEEEVEGQSASIVVEETTSSRLAVATLGALAVLLAAFFLWRIAPSEWSEPKHFALLGVLLVLAALAARLPQALISENPQLGYTLPAVMFGYIAAILYDPRTAVLMAVPMATFTAAATGDAALTVYAGAATVAPVAFVSSVSSRRQLRVAVSLSALVLAPLAGSIAWWFTGAEAVIEAAVFAFLGGVLAGLVAQGLLSFLENLFRVTTTLTLLDLTDRNHPALRLIEEQAPGTFNHSILVGTLAGKAARAIDADPLLAQAAAFYHDLGKTQNPQFFIENQFGVSNPHDDLPAHESAEIIRSHVVDGLRLARQYRIPEDIAAGIRTHHGTGLMRYFYHKALDEDSSADPELFRHGGVKPHRKEMAILMISDACEAAARSLAQQEDPSADSIKKLVASVVGEKLEDGQLDESALTFGDLTRVKHAIVEALIGYYHTRIPYPGFPGPQGGAV